MDKIDLRSDTVSWPTPDMRLAMANAEVGDDVFGDDPTVNRLQALAAERTGMEAALFVSSGTQGNLIAILTHCGRGDQAILGDRAHSFGTEAGGMSALGGVHPWTVPVQPDGTLRLEDIRRAVRPENIHFAPARLLCLENTQGSFGGIPLSVEYTRSATELAHELGLRVHMDGARIFNAATAEGCAVRDLLYGVDSVQFCLSKGLSAPAGSMLCGSAGFIERARRIRKMVGGGMRQVGVLAAAGIIALEEMTQRLHEDHANARRLAEGLAEIDGIVLDVDRVKTNMVMFTFAENCPLDPQTLTDQLAEHDIITYPMNPFRLVTHYWITPERVEQTIDAFRAVFAAA